MRKDSDGMEDYKINNTTQRQFDAAMRREKITISDYYDNTVQYNVFYRRDNRGTSPQGKLRLYYYADTPIEIGTLFVLNGDDYLVISKDAVEGVVYRTSMAVKCTEIIMVNGINVPVVLDSGTYITTSNETISIIDGSIRIITSLTDNVKTMDGYYRCFGGRYSVQNHLYNNGLAYIYLQREANIPDKYTLTYTGISILDVSMGTYQLTYQATKNDVPVENPTLSYTSSNEQIATVDDAGVLTIFSAGNIIITAIWTEENITCESEITVTQSSVSKGYAEIEGDESIRYNIENNWTGHFYNGTGNVVSALIGVWTIEDATFDDFSAVSKSIDGNTISINFDDMDLIGEKFTLQFSPPENEKDNYEPASLIIKMRGIF